MFAIAALTSWEKEDIRVVPVEDQLKIAAYELKLNQVSKVARLNYFPTMGVIAVSKDGQLLTVLRPEKRNYL